jgi:small nuclear ribonucleoprotein (snRNP)-like protein
MSNENMSKCPSLQPASAPAAAHASSSRLPSSVASNNRSPASGTKVANKMMTLASLLRYMEGYEIIVELKTGRRVRGMLVSADDNMNMTLNVSIEQDGCDTLKPFPTNSNAEIWPSNTISEHTIS